VIGHGVICLAVEFSEKGMCGMPDWGSVGNYCRALAHIALHESRLKPSDTVSDPPFRVTNDIANANVSVFLLNRRAGVKSRLWHIPDDLHVLPTQSMTT
jgi:hypothetical protein